MKERKDRLSVVSNSAGRGWEIFPNFMSGYVEESQSLAFFLYLCKKPRNRTFQGIHLRTHFVLPRESSFVQYSIDARSLIFISVNPSFSSRI